jgi:hypothetical protein
MRSTVRAAAAALLLAGACGIVSAASAPWRVTYYLPVDLAALDATVEVASRGSVRWDAEKRQWIFSRESSIARSGALSLKTVADPKAERVLEFPKAKLSDTKATIEISSSGVLRSINSQSTGRGGDILSGIFKFVGNVLGFLPRATAVSAARFTAAPGALAVVRPGAACGQKARRAQAGSDERAFERLTGDWLAQLAADGLSDDALAFIDMEEAGCASLQRLLGSRAELERLRAKRQKLVDDLTGASTRRPAELTATLAQLRLEVTAQEALVEQASAAFAHGLDGFREDKCLGEKKSARKFEALLDLGSLPSADADGAKVVEGLSGEAKDFFEKTGVCAAVEKPATSEGSPPVTYAGVVWRRSRPLRVQVWVLESGDGEVRLRDGGACPAAKVDYPHEALGKKFDSVLDVLHPNGPLGSLPIEAKTFGDRSLAITFNEKGQPTRIDTSGTSTVASIVGATASGLQTLRDEYEASLKKLGEIEAAKRKLGLDALNDEVAALEARKKKLDDEQALLGAEATAGSSLEKKKLDSELELLKSKIALRAAESTAEQQVAIDTLAQRVLETQQRLDALEVQVKLQAERKK